MTTTLVSSAGIGLVENPATCRAQDAELLTLAKSGDAPPLERLLAGGADPDTSDEGGQTALHHAVCGGHAQAAACLLAYGANPSAVDDQGRSPLSLDFTSLETLHAVRQHVRRFRKCDQAEISALSEPARGWASDLARQGIVKISGLIQPDELARMQQDLESFVKDLQRKVLRRQAIAQNYDEEEHWWPKDRAFVSNNAFKHSPQLVKLCCHSGLLSVASHYLGRPAHVQRGVAMRYLPCESREYHMFGWHHDLEDQRFKMMVLLSDVGERDQFMSYVVGSQNLFHPYPMFLKNECSLDYCREQLGEIEIASTIGKAGDIFLFDSNGAHRGNRRLEAATRDAFFVEYTTNRADVWGGDIRPEIFAESPAGEFNPFDWMMAAQKKWSVPKTRQAPAWIDSLPNVATWINSR